MAQQLMRVARAAALVGGLGIVVVLLRRARRSPRGARHIELLANQVAGSRLPMSACSFERQQALLSAMGASADAATVRAVPRYLRVREACSVASISDELVSLGYPPARCTPLPDFVALEPDVPVTTLSCHGPRHALGMDLASGVVVRELLRGASPSVDVPQTSPIAGESPTNS